MSILLEKVQDELIEFTLTLSEDKYKAFISLVPKRPLAIDETSKLLDYALLRDIILKHCKDATLVHFDVIRDAIKNVKEGIKCQNRRVAKGYEPHGGISGKIIYLVKKFDTNFYQDKSSNLLDMHYTSFFDNVKKGDKVARIYRARHGAPGKNALGDEVIGDIGKELNLKISGDFTEEKDEDSNYITLVSLRDGYLKEDDGYLYIKEELVLEGNENFEYGRVNFVGSVYIKGNVYKDFVVHAGKNIVIEGDAHQASLTSEKGDIYVKGFIIGTNKSKISAGGSIFSKGCREAVLEAKGSVYLEKEAFNSKISALESIFVRHGVIIGGNYYVINSIVANEIGCSKEVLTNIYVCSKREIVIIHKELNEKLKMVEKVRSELLNYLGTVAHNPQNLSKVNDELKGNMKIMLKKYKDTEKERDSILKEINKITEEKTIDDKFFCLVNKCIYQGVKLQSEKNTFKILKKEKGPLKIIFKENFDFEMERNYE